VSRVSRLCPVFRAQPGAYPPEAQNRTLRRRAGALAENARIGKNGSGESRLRQTWNTPKWAKSRDFGRRGEKQDKRMASEPTLFLFTTARSADCIKGLRRRCDWRLFGGNYARLASGILQTQSRQGILACRAADWRIMSKEENRLNFRMSPETAEKLEHWYRQDGCRSKNEFLERAVNYYADHLAAGTSTMLPRAVQSAIDGRLQLLEQRLSSLLFKQAVELDMGLSLLAECVNLDESVLRKQRAKSVNDVKRTNGQLRLEQKLRTQEPFDEWPD